MNEILVVCDSPKHGKPTNLATFYYDQDGRWAVSGSNPAARRPSKPGKPLRAIVPLGPDGYAGRPLLRCKRCGWVVPPLSADTLNSIAAQGESEKTIQELRVLASKQQ